MSYQYELSQREIFRGRRRQIAASALHGAPRGGMSVARWDAGGNSVCMVTFTTSHDMDGRLADRSCLARAGVQLATGI